jgi:hypothetical protein
LLTLLAWLIVDARAVSLAERDWRGRDTPIAMAVATFSNVKVTISDLSESGGAIYGKPYSVRVDWTYTWDVLNDSPTVATISLFEEDPWFNDSIDSKGYSTESLSSKSKGSYSGYVLFSKPLATKDTVDGDEDWKSLKICAKVVQKTKKGSGGTSPTATKVVYVQPQTVTGFTTPTYLAADGSVSLSWNTAPGAKKYRLQYNTDGQQGYRQITDTTKTTHKHVPPSTADRFYYAVTGINDVAAVFQASPSAAKSLIVYGKPFPPVSITYPTSTSASYTVIWPKSFGAQKYYVEELKTGAQQWKRIADTSATSVLVSVSGKIKGSSYKYRVQAYNPSGNRGTWATGASTVTIK